MSLSAVKWLMPWFQFNTSACHHGRIGTKLTPVDFLLYRAIALPHESNKCATSQL